MLCTACGKELQLIQISFTKALYVCTRECSYNKGNMCLVVNRHYSKIAKSKEKLTQSDQLTDELDKVFNSLEAKNYEDSSTNKNEEDAWISSLLNGETICEDIEKDFDIEEFLVEVSSNFSDKKISEKQDMASHLNQNSNLKWDNFKFTSVTLQSGQEESSNV